MTTMNESQQRSIISCFFDIHRRIAEMEAWMEQSKGGSTVFAQHVNDLSPTESKLLRDYFTRLRSTMLTCLQEQAIPVEARRTSLRWALQCGCMYVDVVLGELTPNRIAGYGNLDLAGRVAVEKLHDDMRRLVHRISTYLKQGLGKDLAKRLAVLEASPASTEVLKLLDRIINRWQLVEFRPQLDLIVRRLESPQFEIAVFGRVSCGKSSLLNHIAGMDVLPVGVTPITAVPTRLVRGEQPMAQIEFAEMSPKTIPVDHLGEYASEEGNPGNQKHVTCILVQLPSPRLREGVTFVDTPGIGSLALAGGAETLAYLPRCDLGVVLIDAGSTLNEEDLNLLRALYEAGIPAQVLLSKADLLRSTDRQRMTGYIRDHLKRELDLDLPVYLVSTVGKEEALLTEWFQTEIEPLLEKHRSLTEASLQRKIAVLKESVVAVLETVLARKHQGSGTGQPRMNIDEARSLLDAGDNTIKQAQLRCRDWASDRGRLLDIMLHDAAHEAVSSSRAGNETDGVFAVFQKLLAERGQAARGLVNELQQGLGRKLQEFGQVAPVVAVDASAILDLQFRGLPAPDLQRLHSTENHFRRPWFASLWPGLAVWKMQKVLRGTMGDTLQEYVANYDQQVQAWLRACLAQLGELYENQAEVFREQVRRLTWQAGEEKGPQDRDELEADLAYLHQGSVVLREPGDKSPTLIPVTREVSSSDKKE